jgi:hypothetical protein
MSIKNISVKRQKNPIKRQKALNIFCKIKNAFKLKISFLWMYHDLLDLQNLS